MGSIAADAMITWDTETTSLVKPDSVPLAQQPEIIEIGMVKLDDNLIVVDELELLIRPKLMWPVHEQITKWTGISTEMLEDAPSFARCFRRIADFVLGERAWVAHNISHDLGSLLAELQRLGYAARFPFPPEPIDTVELTMDLEAARKKSDRLKLSELYELATGEALVGAHRAMTDARALVPIVRWLREKDQRI